MTWNPQDVFLACAPAPEYGGTLAWDAPELPAIKRATPGLTAVRRLFEICGLDAARFGSKSWNPLREVIAPDARVLIKPNWVFHQNSTGAGLECLITHTSLLLALVEYVALARPAALIIGDAPLQSCDFGALTQNAGLDALPRRGAELGLDIGIRDFRLADRQRSTAARAGADYVLFDLGTHSHLEPVSSADPKFRVTMYDPDILAAAHMPGRHQYLVAREAIEADVVLSVPKLKTHKKAGVTGALKNVVGLNGHKSYLPHHRKGGVADGGDCYLASSRIRRLAEDLLDTANRSQRAAVRSILLNLAVIAARAGRACAGPGGVEGSWHGNDTIWRTTLDLQRILLCGRTDGTLARAPQRRVIHLTDAIVAGQGEGPLRPAALPLGVLTMGSRAAAVEWVNASLLGLDPARVPLTRAACQEHWPAAGVRPEEIRVVAERRRLTVQEAVAKYGATATTPRGWRGHCERSPGMEAVC